MLAAIKEDDPNEVAVTCVDRPLRSSLGQHKHRVCVYPEPPPWETRVLEGTIESSNHLFSHCYLGPTLNRVRDGW